MSAEPSRISEQAADPFKSWAIVELMGHRRLAGLVTEQVVAGAAMLRIDVPADNPQPGDSQWKATQFYGGAAVYCLTPCTEETARETARAVNVAPVTEWELPALRRLTAGGGMDVEIERRVRERMADLADHLDGVIREQRAAHGPEHSDFIEGLDVARRHAFGDLDNVGPPVVPDAPPGDAAIRLCPARPQGGGDRCLGRIIMTDFPGDQPGHTHRRITVATTLAQDMQVRLHANHKNRAGGASTASVTWSAVDIDDAGNETGGSGVLDLHDRGDGSVVVQVARVAVPPAKARVYALATDTDGRALLSPAYEIDVVAADTAAVDITADAPEPAVDLPAPVTAGATPTGDGSATAAPPPLTEQPAPASPSTPSPPTAGTDTAAQVDTSELPRPVYTFDGSLAVGESIDPAWQPSDFQTPDGRALYYFAHDDRAGTVATGDGLGGVWHAYTGPIEPAGPQGSAASPQPTAVPEPSPANTPGSIAPNSSPSATPPAAESVGDLPPPQDPSPTAPPA